MTNEQLTTHAEAVIAAYEKGTCTWMGCDWSEEFAWRGPTMEGVVDAEFLEEGADAEDVVPRGATGADREAAIRAARAAIEFAQRVRRDAERAEAAAAAAADAAQRGDHAEVLEHAEEAEGIEMRYGSAPTWGPLAAAVRAWRDAVPARFERGPEERVASVANAVARVLGHACALPVARAHAFARPQLGEHDVSTLAELRDAWLAEAMARARTTEHGTPGVEGWSMTPRGSLEWTTATGRLHVQAISTLEGGPHVRLTFWRGGDNPREIACVKYDPRDGHTWNVTWADADAIHGREDRIEILDNVLRETRMALTNAGPEGAVEAVERALALIRATEAEARRASDEWERARATIVGTESPPAWPSSVADIEGVGRKKAAALAAAGFTTLDDLRAAHEDDLRAVEGISPLLARKIKLQIMPHLEEQ